MLVPAAHLDTHAPVSFQLGTHRSALALHRPQCLGWEKGVSRVVGPQPFWRPPPLSCKLAEQEGNCWVAPDPFFAHLSP